jgi:hypothetical protein
MERKTTGHCDQEHAFWNAGHVANMIDFAGLKPIQAHSGKIIINPQCCVKRVDHFSFDPQQRHFVLARNLSLA